MFTVLSSKILQSRIQTIQWDAEPILVHDLLGVKVLAQGEVHAARDRSRKGVQKEGGPERDRLLPSRRLQVPLRKGQTGTITCPVTFARRVHVQEKPHEESS